MGDSHVIDSASLQKLDLAVFLQDNGKKPIDNALCLCHNPSQV
jgi:hypothetical protein